MPSEMPPAENGIFVPTLNQMGYMTTTLDYFSRACVEQCAPGKDVLEIGAAYGVATLECLKRGARVVANDLDPRHLEILAKRAGSFAATLTLDSSAFPSQTSFSPNSFDAILICRVAHFFAPAELEAAFREFHEWLRPKGRLFFVSESPYLKNFSAFLPTYEARKAQGAAYPGFVENVQAVAPDRGKLLPPQMHFLDPEVLSRLCQGVKLDVIENRLFARPEFPPDLRLDGRESVGLIAEKRS